jgi:hypothetical protein
MIKNLLLIVALISCACNAAAGSPSIILSCKPSGKEHDISTMGYFKIGDNEFRQWSAETGWLENQCLPTLRGEEINCRKDEAAYTVERLYVTLQGVVASRRSTRIYRSSGKMVRTFWNARSDKENVYVAECERAEQPLLAVPKF